MNWQKYEAHTEVKVSTHKQNLKDQGFPHREGETDKKKEPVSEIVISSKQVQAIVDCSGKQVNWSSIFFKKFDPGKSHTFCPNSYLFSDRLLWMSVLFFHGSTIGRHYCGSHWSIERKRAHRINYFTLLYAFLRIQMDSTFFGSGIDATSSERRDKTNSSWVYNNLG